MAGQIRKGSFQFELTEDKRKRAEKKDKNFVLSGEWKKSVREEEGFSVYAVDGEWVRNNLSVIFGQGGHGYVHEFISLNEIWIATNHRDRSRVSKEYFDSTVIHEITEYKEMSQGQSFPRAHQIALAKEREVGILEDPEKDPYAA